MIIEFIMMIMIMIVLFWDVGFLVFFWINFLVVFKCFVLNVNIVGEIFDEVWGIMLFVLGLIDCCCKVIFWVIFVIDFVIGLVF